MTMSANLETSDAADPNLVPLLDVVLQLIMFFMITVNFVRVDQFDDCAGLKQRLPAGDDGGLGEVSQYERRRLGGCELHHLPGGIELVRTPRTVSLMQEI